MTMEWDVIVLGTGAAGLTAAMAAHDAGASVLLLEKSDHVGGTTALSGGVLWLPANPRATDAGIADSRDDAMAYLESLSLGHIDPAMAAAFVDTVGDLLAWLDANTPLSLSLIARYPDYHPEHPGGKPGGGRSLEPDVFPLTARLGPWAERIAACRDADGMATRISEMPIGGGTLDPEALRRRTADGETARGRGLVGALLAGCLDRGIEPQTGVGTTGLIQHQGRITGVSVRGPDGTTTDYHAARGVVLATGGFEHDPALVRAFLRGPAAHFPTAPSNTGDGIAMAMQAGAALGNMREAWWVPIALITDPDGNERPTLILRERTVPGSIMINKRGRRFVNEAANYNALGAAFHEFDVNRFAYANQPCWLVLDQACLDRYGFAHIAPGGDASGVLLSAPTIDELGQELGIDPEALAATISTWNAAVDAGDDAAFDRGKSIYDGWSGDQAYYPGPKATLGPIADGPFYAIEIHASALGTKGGPRTDVHGAVLSREGKTIAGLYAAGNAMAGPTGMVYGGAGGTLGPAMVFGYRAGRHAAGDNR